MTYHTPVPQSCPPASKLGPQMILFLQELLSLSSPAPDPTIKRGRGRPATFCLQQIWLGLLLGGLQQADSFRQIWRHLSTRSQGSFPLLNVTYEAVRKRVLSAGLESLQTLFEEVSERLRQRLQALPTSALPLASFAPQIVVLDESTFDQLKRLTTDLQEVAPGDAAHLQPGKLAGLFDLRTQQWVRLQFRADGLAGCNTHLLPLLQGLQRGALIFFIEKGFFSL